MFQFLNSVGEVVETCNADMPMPDIIAIASGLCAVHECNITITKNGHCVDVCKYREDV